MNKRRDFYRRFLGSRVSVLVEQAVDETQGIYRGYSKNYLPVQVPLKRGRINCEVGVALERLEGGRLRGRLAESE